MRLQKYSQRFNNGEAIGDFKTWGKREIMGNKDSWTREEVEKLCRDAWQVGFNVGQNDEVSPSYLTKENWIKENL